jgi:hypothetical protein
MRPKYIPTRILFYGFVIAVALSLSYVYAQGIKSEKPACGIENCHGLDIVCGSNIPEACTAMYALGDFCRQYAQCQELDRKCQFVSNKKFDSCKNCVEQCNQQFQQDPVGAFDCEAKCRKAIEGEGENP